MLKESPPYVTLINILETCPWAIFTYYLLWKDRSKNAFEIDKKDIQDAYIISPTLFKEYLFDLSQVDAILYPPIDATGYPLC